MDRLKKIVAELNLVADKVIDLKTASQEIQGFNQRIDGGNPQVTREAIETLLQAQQAINIINASLNPIRDVIVRERIELEKIPDQKKAAPS